MAQSYVGRLEQQNKDLKQQLTNCERRFDQVISEYFRTLLSNCG